MSYPYIDKILTFENVVEGSKDGFVADPFVIDHNDIEHVFFEIFQRNPREKTIGCAKQSGDGSWRFLGDAVANQEIEYSFPYIFREGSEYYMIPSIEHKKKGGIPIRLYKSESFPLNWDTQTTYSIAGGDPVLIEWNQMYYLFTHNDGIRIYYSADFTRSEWCEHPESPLQNSQINRMGGRPVIDGDNLYLLYQDGSNHYGELVRCFEVKTLNKEQFEQAEISDSPITCGQYNGSWNHLGMHHVDFCSESDFAIVDGHTNNGWSIGLVKSNSEPTRLTPAPNEFSGIQKIRRARRLATDRLQTMRKVRKYHKDNGTISLFRKAVQKLP